MLATVEARSSCRAAGGRFELRAGSIPADRVGSGGIVNFTAITYTTSGAEVSNFTESSIHALRTTHIRTSVLAPETPVPKYYGPVCASKRIGPITGVNDLVGETFSSKKGSWETFNYDRSQKSTIGVGVSIEAKGGFGGYKADGTTTVATDDSVSYGTKHGRASMNYRADFDAAVFRVVYCAAVTGVQTVVHK